MDIFFRVYEIIFGMLLIKISIFDKLCLYTVLVLATALNGTVNIYTRPGLSISCFRFSPTIRNKRIFIYSLATLTVLIKVYCYSTIAWPYFPRIIV